MLRHWLAMTVREGLMMAVKILERCLCPSCERDMTAAHVVHKEVPYSQG